MVRCRLHVLVFAALALRAPAAPVVLDDADSLAGWQAGGGAAVARADSAASGQGALRVTLPGMVSKVLGNRWLPGSAAWDRYVGLSFQVKGDGSDGFGCFAVGPAPQGQYTCVVYFPMKDTTWHKLTYAWRDLVPEGQWDGIGMPGALPPSGITALRFGSRWNIEHNNAPIPKHTFDVDQIQLEETVPAAPAVPPLAPFDGVVAKLKAKQPVQIVCMGDSITAGTALADKDKERYAVGVQTRLRQWLGYEQVFCESRAVGGAKVTDACAWVPRDFAGDAPDLVTVLYGYNDKSNAYTLDYFQRELKDYLKRVAVATGGKTAALLLATLPGCGPRYVMMDDFADGVRAVAKEQGLRCFDLAQVFKSLGREAMEEYFADQAHPNAEGHQLLAEALARYLAGEAGVNPPKTVPVAKPTVSPGAPQHWATPAEFAGWRVDGDEVRRLKEPQPEDGARLEYTMTAPAKDHRRAWSPLIPVLAGQRWTASAKVKCLEANKGTVGLYLATYTKADGSDEAQIKPIRAASNLLGVWETVSGHVEIGQGTAAVRVLLWSARDSLGHFQVGEVSLVPK